MQRARSDSDADAAVETDASVGDPAEVSRDIASSPAPAGTEGANERRRLNRRPKSFIQFKAAPLEMAVLDAPDSMMSAMSSEEVASAVAREAEDLGPVFNHKLVAPPVAGRSSRSARRRGTRSALSASSPKRRSEGPGTWSAGRASKGLGSGSPLSSSLRERRASNLKGRPSSFVNPRLRFRASPVAARTPVRQAPKKARGTEARSRPRAGWGDAQDGRGEDGSGSASGDGSGSERRDAERTGFADFSNPSVQPESRLGGHATHDRLRGDATMGSVPPIEPLAPPPVAVPFSGRAQSAYSQLRGNEPLREEDSFFIDLPRSTVTAGPAAHTADVSFASDTLQQGVVPPGMLHVDRARFRPSFSRSRLPERDHITRTSKLPPAFNENGGESVYDPARREWVTTVFPSLFPSGRRDVRLLEAWLDANEPGAIVLPDVQPGKQSKEKVMQQTAQGMKQLAAAQDVYSEALAEVVRQVSTHCVERGQLLSRLWGSTIDLFAGTVALLQPLRDRVMELEEAAEGARKRDVKFESRIEDLERQLDHAKSQLEAAGLRSAMYEAEAAAKDRILNRTAVAKSTAGFRKSFIGSSGADTAELQAEMEDLVNVLEATSEKLRDAQEITGSLREAREAAEAAQKEAESAKVAAERARDNEIAERMELQSQLDKLNAEWEEKVKLLLGERKDDLIAKMLKDNPDMAPEQAEEMAEKKLHEVEDTAALIEKHNLQMAEQMQGVKHKDKQIDLLQQRVRELEAGCKLRDDLIEMLRSRLRVAGVEIDEELGGVLQTLSDHKITENTSYMQQLEFPDFMQQNLATKEVQTDAVQVVPVGVRPLSSSSSKRRRKRKGTGDASMGDFQGFDTPEDAARGTAKGFLKGRSARDMFKRVSASSSFRMLGGAQPTGNSVDVPVFWETFMASMPKNSPQPKPWSLPKFRQLLLDCFIEKIRVDTADAKSPAEMTPFVCDFFFQKYGVKRLVQLRLREVIVTCKKYRSDARVSFFARVCGLWSALPFEVLSHYLFALSLIMIDFMHARSSGEKEWINSPDGHTWVPVRLAKKCIARLMADSPRSNKVKDVLALVDKLPELTQERFLSTGRRGPQVKGGPTSSAVSALSTTASVRKTAMMLKRGKKIDLDEFMQLVLDEYTKHTQALRARYIQVFKTVDADGNGALDIDEFVTAVSLIEGVRLSEQEMRHIFLESVHGEDEAFVDQNRFIQTMQKHNIRFTNVDEVIARTSTDAIVADVDAGDDDDDDMKRIDSLDTMLGEIQERNEARSDGRRGINVPPTIADDGSEEQDSTAGSVAGAEHSQQAPQPQTYTSSSVFIREAVSRFHTTFDDPTDDLEELQDSWDTLRPTVVDQIVQINQNPATRILLKTRCQEIDDLLSGLREKIESYKEETVSTVEDTDDMDASYDSMVALREKQSSEVREAWDTFRKLVKNVQRIIRNRRMRAIAFIQKMVRGIIARRRFFKLQWATLLLHLAVRRWLKRTAARRAERARLRALGLSPDEVDEELSQATQSDDAASIPTPTGGSHPVSRSPAQKLPAVLSREVDASSQVDAPPSIPGLSHADGERTAPGAPTPGAASPTMEETKSGGTATGESKGEEDTTSASKVTEGAAEGKESAQATGVAATAGGHDAAGRPESAASAIAAAQLGAPHETAKGVATADVAAW